MTINKQIFITSSILIFTIIFFGYSNLDIILQDNFFNFATNQWILDRNAEPIKFILYDGIKKVLILFAVLMLLSLIFFRKKELIKKYKKGILVIIFSAILVPVIVGGFKKYTNMPCPKNEIHYGGIYPRVAVWEHYPKYFKPKGNIKCWPAGHASGGFALLSLLFLFTSMKGKNRALLLAMSVGWSMGLYKMAIGDHFLSHTVITMVMAWLIILIIARSLGFKKVYENFDKGY